MTDSHETVVHKLVDLYHMLVCHNGFGDMSIEIRILKRGQKEVIVRCGKQYRFVVDTPGPGEQLGRPASAAAARDSTSS